MPNDLYIHSKALKILQSHSHHPSSNYLDAIVKKQQAKVIAGTSRRFQKSGSAEKATQITHR